MSRILNINELQEGMILANPITNNFGQVLLPAGIELTCNHFRILRTWNIFQVSIVTEGDNENIVLSKSQMDNAGKYILSKMKWRPRNGYEKDMFISSVIQRAKEEMIQE